MLVANELVIATSLLRLHLANIIVCAFVYLEVEILTCVALCVILLNNVNAHKLMCARVCVK